MRSKLRIAQYGCGKMSVYTMRCAIEKGADTPMHHRARGLLGDAIYDELMVPQVHLRRVGKPEEIAASVLCSDEAGYITGTTLTPDGGFTLTPKIVLLEIV